MVKVLKTLLLVAVLALGGVLGYDLKKTLDIHGAVLGAMATYLHDLQEQKKLPTVEELKRK